MTRNSQDDLYIAYHIISKYMTFLKERIDFERERIRATCEEALGQLKTGYNYQFVQEYENEHLYSLDKFADALVLIEQIIIQFYQDNPVEVSMFLVEEFYKNIKEHRMILEKSFEELDKYRF